jgi:peptidyl-tRNA hydrolase, PTH1 family
MILIAGLGNPGTKYSKTRHNIGFLVIDKLAQKFGVELKEEKKFKAEFIKLNEGYEEAILVKPLTFMNNSGEAIKKIADYFNVYENDIWVIHDDLDIDLGKLRIRKGGSSAGQKGVESAITHLGTPEFIRFRVGIGPKNPPEIASEDFVLGKFSQTEKEIIADITNDIVETITEVIKGDQELKITTK